MLFEDLYNDILVKPIKEDKSLNNLLIVSGYSTSAMAFHHLNELESMSVSLICGMTVLDGISLSNHKGFCKLANEDFKNRFSCSYIYKGLPVHSKLYIWCNDKTPKRAFLGSANYTQSAMRLKKRRELMIPCSPSKAFDYYKTLVDDSIFCVHSDVSEFICLYSDVKQKTAVQEKNKSLSVDYSGLEHVTSSLLARDGSLPERSGLNWGQRPEYRRNRNQAYIKIPAYIYKTDFFPPKGTHFTVLTDDAKTLVCTRAQEKFGKAIETPQNNSQLGEYFRNRLGLSNGAFVSKEDLIKYGRTDIDFYKIDDETYYLDFSPHNS